MHKIIVLGSQHGRLGNKLWTHANVYAYAIKYGFRVYNPDLYKTSNIFTNTQGRVYLNKLLSGISRINSKINILPSLVLENSQLLNLDDINLSSIYQKNIFFLHGLYFYAPECLQEFSDHIRELSTPEFPVLSNITKILEQARRTSDIVIGVHIRHGDYRLFCDGIMFYELCEYVDIMRSLQDQFPNQRVSFIICSDEPQDLSSYPDLNLILGHGGVVEDLYTLAQCDFIFGPNSTFSHWASFWGQVPMHILNYKAESLYGLKPIYKPRLDLDFKVFDVKDFGKFAKSKITIEQLTDRA